MVRRRVGFSAFVAAIPMAVVVTALGCADFATPLDPSGGAPDAFVANPSFTAHIVPVFEKRCSLGGCHSLATRQAGLALTASAAYDALVGVPSALAGGQVRVRPADAAGSWLVTMIGPDESARRGFSRMPLATHPLTDNQIANIVRWIEQGALRN